MIRSIIEIDRVTSLHRSNCKVSIGSLQCLRCYYGKVSTRSFRYAFYYFIFSVILNCHIISIASTYLIHRTEHCQIATICKGVLRRTFERYGNRSYAFLRRAECKSTIIAALYRRSLIYDTIFRLIYRRYYKIFIIYRIRYRRCLYATESQCYILCC